MSKIGICLIIVILLFCIFGPFFSPYNISQTDLSQAKQGISSTHWLGTDRVGRDILTQLMFGGRISVIVGICVAFFGALIGTAVGVTAGYFGGRIDGVLMGMTDVIMCLPFLGIVLLSGAISFEMNLGDNFRMVLLVAILAFFMWPSLARLVRSKVLVLSLADHVTVAKIMGVPNTKIIVNHIIPMVFPYIIANATLMVGDAILSESALSFLGMGVSTTSPTWGSMIRNVTDNFIFSNYPLMWVPAGICICLTIISINMIGVKTNELG